MALDNQSALLIKSTVGFSKGESVCTVKHDQAKLEKWDLLKPNNRIHYLESQIQYKIKT